MSFLDKLIDFGEAIWDSTDPKRDEASSINKFIANIKTHGVSTPSNYVVSIDMPICMKSAGPRAEAINALANQPLIESVCMLCKSAQIPSLNFLTSTSTINGVRTEVPYEKEYGTLTLSFYMDGKMETRIFFDQWLDAIQLHSTRGFEYMKNYQTTIVVGVFNRNDKKVYSIEIKDAYPKALETIDLDYGMTNEIMVLTVQFAYTTYVATPHQAKEEPAKSLLDKLFGDSPIYQSAKSAFETIGTIISTTDEYTGRIEKLKGMVKGFETQGKGISGIFKSKIGRIKDLGKWL